MNKEDKLVLGTLAGLDLILSPEHYEEYKGTLQDQLEEAYKEIERLQNIINELENIIYIKKIRVENEEDYGHYYIEGLSSAIKNSKYTYDGVLIQTVRNTIINVCDEVLNKLKELKEGNNGSI